MGQTVPSRQAAQRAMGLVFLQIRPLLFEKPPAPVSRGGGGGLQQIVAA